jgi:maternal embryonic leucine zipper kinase
MVILALLFLFLLFFHSLQSGVYVEPQFLSPLCKEYLRSMLTVDPRKRANIQQLLSHPWLNKNYEQQLKWQTIYNREIIDEDILRELVYFYRTSMEVMRQKIKEWRFDNLTTTYLILLQKSLNTLTKI